MKATLALGMAAAVAGALLYLIKKGGISASSFDVTSSENLAYRLGNSITQAITGDKNQTVGGLVYDKANPRAGLADNEYSPAPGLIVTLPRTVTANATMTAADESALVFGGGKAGMFSNEGGAAVGRVVSPGF